MSLSTEAPRLILTLAGMEQPDSSHWLSRWEEERPDCQRVHLGVWDRPHRNSWITAIDHAVKQADRPVILVARGLACHAVAWWASFEKPSYGHPVAGALLVAPPNVDTASDDLRLVGFGPTPKALLPFPSIVVASRNDPRMDFAGAQALARFWGSDCADGGAIGSASGLADLGRWSEGAALLDRLLAHAIPGAGQVAPTDTPFGIAPLRSVTPVRVDLSL
ncbi:RBBP9/YdeN family alpha/beta hydrolase [Sphingobium algorifonticola]|nr:alpha/beta hydrolase [Sphingobium algorifonticola]